MSKLGMRRVTSSRTCGRHGDRVDLSDAGLRERAYRDCPLQGNGGHDYDCHVCVPIMERYRALRDAARAEQRKEALKRVNAAIRKDTDAETMDALYVYIDELRAAIREQG